MLPIVVRDGNVEKALKQMKRQAQKDGLSRRLREIVAFEKPSVERQKKRIEKLRRISKSKKGRLSRYGY